MIDIGERCVFFEEVSSHDKDTSAIESLLKDKIIPVAKDFASSDMNRGENSDATRA